MHQHMPFPDERTGKFSGYEGPYRLFSLPTSSPVYAAAKIRSTPILLLDRVPITEAIKKPRMDLMIIIMKRKFITRTQLSIKHESGFKFQLPLGCAQTGTPTNLTFDLMPWRGKLTPRALAAVQRLHVQRLLNSEFFVSFNIREYS